MVDLNNDDIENSNSVDTGNLNGVRYLSHYSTLQAAVDDTPAGGTLKVDGDFDVSNIGTATASKTFEVAGDGWHEDENAALHGSVIRNSGGDAVDSPILDLTGDSTGKNDSHPAFRHFATVHEGATSPAFRTMDMARPHEMNVRIELNNSGLTGFSHEGHSFQVRAFGCYVTNFTQDGWFLDGSGSDDVFMSCHATSGSGDPRAGLLTRRPGTWVFGGQFNASNSGGTGAGVRFDVDGASDVDSGGAWGVLGEIGRSVVDITGSGSGRFNNVICRNIRGGGTVNSAVRFDRSRGCLNEYPKVDGVDHTIWAGSNSFRDATHLGVDTAQGTYTDGGATSPLIVVDVGTATDAQLGNITTGSVPVKVAYSNDHNGPVVHDTTDWREFSSTTFTP